MKKATMIHRRRCDCTEDNMDAGCAADLMASTPTIRRLRAEVRGQQNTLGVQARKLAFGAFQREEAVAWLKVALTRKTWGSVEAAYSSLTGMAPPVSMWRKEFAGRMGGLRRKRVK